MVCSLYSSANKLGNYVTLTGFVQSLEICPANLPSNFPDLYVQVYTQQQKLRKTAELAKITKFKW